MGLLSCICLLQPPFYFFCYDLLWTNSANMYVWCMCWFKTCFYDQIAFYISLDTGTIGDNHKIGYLIIHIKTAFFIVSCKVFTLFSD